MAGRRPGLRADDRRRLWRIRRGTGGAMPAGARRRRASSMPAACPRPSARSGPMSSSGCICRRERCSWCRAGRAASALPRSSSPRRSAPRCWRPPAPTRNAGRAAITAPMLRSTTARRILCRSARSSPTAAASMRSSTWSAATTSRAQLDLLAREGRLCFVALMRGSKVEADFGLIQRKHLTVTGSTLRSRTGRAEGGDHRRLEGEGLAALGGRQTARLHLQAVPAGRGRRGASPDGIEPAYRQDPARPVREVADGEVLC